MKPQSVHSFFKAKIGFPGLMSKFCFLIDRTDKQATVFCVQDSCFPKRKYWISFSFTNLLEGMTATKRYHTIWLKYCSMSIYLINNKCMHVFHNDQVFEHSEIPIELLLSRGVNGCSVIWTHLFSLPLL